MSEISVKILSVCLVIISAELISKLCPQNAMVKFTKSVGILVLLVSLLLSFTSFDWDEHFDIIVSTDNKLLDYIQQTKEEAAQREVESYLSGLLGSVGINAEKIYADIDICDDNSIIIKRITALFKYETDAQRAEILLENELGDDMNTEVRTDVI